MSKYFDRLKQLETEKNSLYSYRPEVPKPPKAPFVSFVSTPQHINVKKNSNNEKERELDLLVDFVATSNNFTEQEVFEGRKNALNDLDSALVCFRELAAACRVVKANAILAENPEQQRAIFTDIDSDPNNVILTIALRGLSICVVHISKARYDPFQLLDLIEKYGHQTH